MSTPGQNPVDLTSAPPAGIEELVRSFTSLARAAWGQPGATYESTGVGEILTPAAFKQEVMCGSLVAPYFGVLQEDGSLADTLVAETRVVQTKRRPEYLKPDAAQACLQAGDVLVLAQIEDWHHGVSILVKALKDTMQAQVSVDAYLGGPDATKGVACISDAQVFIVQLEGRSRWTFGSGDHPEEAALATDQVLSIPPRTTRRGVSDGMDFLYLVISLQPPTVRDLAELTLARFYKGPAAAEVAGSHHLQAAEAKVDWLRGALQSHLTAENLTLLATQAVRNRQQEALGN
jgi:hypothetical protein